MKTLTIERAMELTSKYLEVMVAVGAKYSYKGEYYAYDEIKVLVRDEYKDHDFRIVPAEYTTVRINTEWKEVRISKEEYENNKRTKKYSKVTRTLEKKAGEENKALEILTNALETPTQESYELLKKAYNEKVGVVKEELEGKLAGIDNDYRYTEVYKEELKEELKEWYKDFDALGELIESVKQSYNEQEEQAKQAEKAKEAEAELGIKKTYVYGLTRNLGEYDTKTSVEKVLENVEEEGKNLKLTKGKVSKYMKEIKRDYKEYVGNYLDELDKVLDTL